MGEAPDAATALAERVREHIIVGGFPPGDRLPTERDLAEAFELSRNTVRRAMRALADEGLVVTEYGRSGGTRVVAQRSLVAALKLVVGGASRGRTQRVRQELRRLYEYRLLLEPAAAAFAAERAKHRQRQRLSAACDRSVHDLFTYQLADDAVHDQIAEASGNDHLRHAIQRSRRATLRLGNVWWMGTDWLQVYPDQRSADAAFRHEHERCVRAVVQGRPAAAERAMADHLRESLQQFEVLLGSSARVR